MLSQCWPKLSSITEEIKYWPIHVRTAAFLSLLPNLKALKINGHFDSKFFNVFQLDGYSEEFDCFRSLIEIFLDWSFDMDCGKSLFRRKFHVFNVLPLFLLPKIHTLYLKLALDSEHEQTVPHNIPQQYGNSSVKEIVIESWKIGAISLAGLLKLPAALEKFTCIYDPHILQYGMPTSRELAKRLLP
jgi:hypothetical protein